MHDLASVVEEKMFFKKLLEMVDLRVTPLMIFLPAKCQAHPSATVFFFSGAIPARVPKRAAREARVVRNGSTCHTKCLQRQVDIQVEDRTLKKPLAFGLYINTLVFFKGFEEMRIIFFAGYIDRYIYI